MDKSRRVIKTMDVYTPVGSKVIVTEQTKRNGYDVDKENVKKYLDLHKEYTVSYISVGQSHSTVYLEEVPFVPFNTSNFTNVENIKEIN